MSISNFDGFFNTFTYKITIHLGGYMDERERRKLVQQRKKKQQRREFEQNLKRELSSADKKAKQQQIREKHTGKYGDRIFIFFTTFGILYAFYFVTSIILNFMFGAGTAMLGLNFSWLIPVIHILILGASIISAVRNRSILDDIVDRI